MEHIIGTINMHIAHKKIGAAAIIVEKSLAVLIIGTYLITLSSDDSISRLNIQRHSRTASREARIK